MNNERYINQVLAELELRRRDFHTFLSKTVFEFVDGWFYRELCAELQQFMLDVRDKKSPRLILTVPPRHLKSETCSVRFPLYCLLNNPTWEIVVSSYGQTLVERFSRKARMLIENEYIKSLWRVEYDRKHFSVKEWKIGKAEIGGTFKAVSRGGPLTGSGSNVLCIDDPLKDVTEADSKTIRDSLWEWYSGVARTRLAPGGGILVIQTRWHQDDLVGRLLAEESKSDKTDKWKKIDYRAIAETDEKHRKAGEALHPERFSVDELERTKASMVPRLWNALYQQNPTTAGGTIIKESWIKTYREHELPDLALLDEAVQSWDLRFSAKDQAGTSYVVGQVWYRFGSRYYLIHQIRERIGYVQSRDAIRELSSRFPRAVAKLIENKANGPAISDDLKNEIDGIVMFEPRGDKIQRLERVAPLFMAGNVFIPSDEHWSKEYLSELVSFPGAPNDDQVDATSQALAWFKERNGELDDILFV